MWKSVDDYFRLVNSVYCNRELCRCKLTKPGVMKQFERHRFISSDELDFLDQPSSQEEEFNFNNCPDSAKREVERLYMSNPNNTNHYIKPDKFFDYWRGIEKRFKCTGWCQTTYTNIYTLKKEHMFKYTFSDLNRGPVRYPGCLNVLVNWLPGLIGAVGGCLIVAAFLQTLNMLFAIGLLSQPLDDTELNSKKIENNEDENKAES